MNLRSAATLGLATVALLAAGCGDDDETDAGTGRAATEQAAAPPETEAAPPATEATPAEPEAPTAPEEPAAGGPKLSTGVLDISEDTSKKPRIPRAEGKPPKELVAEDVVKGRGPAAQPGDLLTMQYVGVLFRDGEQFDASWDRGEPFQFPIGAQQVIPGWDQGILGMRVGGRRTLVIPPDLAYGPDPSGPGGANQTLIFVVDLKKIGP